VRDKPRAAAAVAVAVEEGTPMKDLARRSSDIFLPTSTPYTT